MTVIERKKGWIKYIDNGQTMAKNEKTGEIWLLNERAGYVNRWSKVDDGPIYKTSSNFNWLDEKIRQVTMLGQI